MFKSVPLSGTRVCSPQGSNSPMEGNVFPVLKGNTSPRCPLGSEISVTPCHCPLHTFLVVFLASLSCTEVTSSPDLKKSASSWSPFQRLQHFSLPFLNRLSWYKTHSPSPIIPVTLAMRLPHSQAVTILLLTGYLPEKAQVPRALTSSSAPLGGVKAPEKPKPR